MLARSSGYSAGIGDTHYFYHADGNGNITYLVDGSQAMAATYRYDPFGNIVSSSGTQASANVYSFSSKEVHANSGMYMYLYRFYDPSLQRWLNRDPLDESGFETARRRRGMKGAYSVGPSAEISQGQNLYSFVGNKPVRYFDSLGLSAFCDQLNNRMNELSEQAMLADMMGDYATFTELSHQLFGLAQVYGDLCQNPPPPPPVVVPVVCPVQGRRVPQDPYPPTNRTFCQNHPWVCGGIVVGLVGTGVAVTCVIQPELCPVAIGIAAPAF